MLVQASPLAVKRCVVSLNLGTEQRRLVITTTGAGPRPAAATDQDPGIVELEAKGVTC